MLSKKIDELAKRIKDNHSTKKPRFDVYYKYITISHSVKKIIMSKLINSYSFWRSSYPFGGLILGEFRSRFSYCGREFDMETDVST